MEYIITETFYYIILKSTWNYDVKYFLFAYDSFLIYEVMMKYIQIAEMKDKRLGNHEAKKKY